MLIVFNLSFYQLSFTSLITKYITYHILIMPPASIKNKFYNYILQINIKRRNYMQNSTIKKVFQFSARYI